MEKTYTVFAHYPHGSVEEIDVKATNKIEARAKAKELLDKYYEKGYKLGGVTLRTGLYF